MGREKRYSARQCSYIILSPVNNSAELLKITWGWAVARCVFEREQKAGAFGFPWVGLCVWQELTWQGWCSCCCPLPAAPGIAAGPRSSGELLRILPGIVSCQMNQLNWDYLLLRLKGKGGKEGGGEQGRGALFVVCLPHSLRGQLHQTLRCDAGLVPRAAPGSCLQWKHLLQNKDLEIQSHCCCCSGI